MLEEIELDKGKKVFRDELAIAIMFSHTMIFMAIVTNLQSCILYPKFSALKQHTQCQIFYRLESSMGLLRLKASIR